MLSKLWSWESQKRDLVSDKEAVHVAVKVCNQLAQDYCAAAAEVF